MKYSGLYALKHKRSCLITIILFLYISPTIYAMENGQYDHTSRMEQEEKCDGGFLSSPPAPTSISLPTFSHWCTQTGFYSLNAADEFPDPELADIEYTSYLHESARATHPNYYFESFDRYVRERDGDGHGINLEKWSGATSIELYKKYLETAMAQAQELAEQAAREYAQQMRANIPLRVIPRHETFKLELCNGDTWRSFQEKIAQHTGIPAESQKVQIGGTGNTDSLEDLIEWVNSGKCVLVINSRLIQ